MLCMLQRVLLIGTSARAKRPSLRARRALWMAVVRREVEREPNEGARERILRQWRRLYGNCGLKLKNAFAFN